MQRKNPHQHSHNWEMRFTEWHWSTDVPENLKPYSPGGFNMRRYWACIRGGKVKHTRKASDYLSYSSGQLMRERVFLAASGFNYIDTSKAYVQDAG